MRCGLGGKERVRLANKIAYTEMHVCIRNVINSVKEERRTGLDAMTENCNVEGKRSERREGEGLAM